MYYRKQIWANSVELEQTSHTPQNTTVIRGYSKCPKISYTKSVDKMAYANSVDPGQTAPDQSLHCLPFHQVF